ncbi:SEC-C motif-containing protein [Micromonospora pisi]|uniref:SEC-C motif-containing protein n=1 Tax=Micromonospora pisi TaxID=589240 RepID=A0A495J9Z2_9ACTN|nr:SEC-C metal-binding domain-containing protein [Micromonospora pisi]RKR85846.1 SEC-C motif-containing protein [Micromonospora pisi]
MVPTTDVLTSADLTELRQSALGAANPLGIAADLADAAEQGRLADPADTGYALTLAAEIAESRAKLDAALRYADRAVEAYRTQEDSQANFSRALRARILFRAGRDDEATAELTALRPLLTEQADAAAYISAALDAGGRSVIAEQWLSEAVETVLGERAATAEQLGEPRDPDSPGVLFFLLQQRHRVRRDLALPHDQHDNLADRLENQLTSRAANAVAGTAVTELLFWPQDQFDRVRSEWPDLTGVYGQDWDEHRARLERELVRLAGAGRTGLSVLKGSVDGLSGFATRRNGDPTDQQVRAGYAQELEGRQERISWPPERNGTCWCGSGNKYKKCCLPRSRA